MSDTRYFVGNSNGKPIEILVACGRSHVWQEKYFKTDVECAEYIKVAAAAGAVGRLPGVGYKADTLYEAKGFFVGSVEVPAYVPPTPKGVKKKATATKPKSKPKPKVEPKPTKESEPDIFSLMEGG